MDTRCTCTSQVKMKEFEMCPLAHLFQCLDTGSNYAMCTLTSVFDSKYTKVTVRVILSLFPYQLFAVSM